MRDSASKYFHFNDLDPISEQWQAIARYNASIKERLPAGASDFVFSGWHYDYHDPRCPHDSWIESIDFRFSDDRSKLLGIGLRLLGAFHDRHISINYEGVTELSFQGTLISDRGRDVEWIYDEVHLLSSGRVEHVIEFSDCLVGIECRDFEYRSEVFRSVEGP